MVNLFIKTFIAGYEITRSLAPWKITQSTKYFVLPHIKNQFDNFFLAAFLKVAAAINTLKADTSIERYSAENSFVRSTLY